MLIHHLRATFESDFVDDLNAVRKHLAILDSEATLAHRGVVHTFVTRSRPPELPGTEAVLQQQLNKVSRLHRRVSLTTVQHTDACASSVSSSGSHHWIVPNDYLSSESRIKKDHPPGYFKIQNTQLGSMEAEAIPYGLQGPLASGRLSLARP